MVADTPRWLLACGYLPADVGSGTETGRQPPARASPSAGAGRCPLGAAGRCPVAAAGAWPLGRRTVEFGVLTTTWPSTGGEVGGRRILARDPSSPPGTRSPARPAHERAWSTRPVPDAGVVAAGHSGRSRTSAAAGCRRPRRVICVCRRSSGPRTSRGRRSRVGGHVLAWAASRGRRERPSVRVRGVPAGADASHGSAQRKGWRRRRALAAAQPPMRLPPMGQQWRNAVHSAVLRHLPGSCLSSRRRRHRARLSCRDPSECPPPSARWCRAVEHTAVDVALRSG